VVAFFLATFLVASAWADDAPDLRRLFPTERDIFVAGDGLVRLALPPEVLAASRPDLSDLRVFDRQEHEVPYVIDAGLPAGEAVEMVRAHDAVVVEARREEVPREHLPSLYRETYVVAAPPPSGTAWDLVFDVQRPSFVRRLTLAAVAADGTTRPLPAGESIFRLANPAAERLRVPLPALAGERLAVTIEGEDGGYLQPALHFETGRVFASRPGAEVPLEELARESRDGRTVIELVRPRGLVPDALRLETATGSFNRTVDVWDEGPGRDAVRLGRAPLFRLQGPVSVDERELAMRPARGDRLRVEIDDGDSQPLAAPRFAALVRQPALVFPLRGAGDAPAGTLRYGGGRAHAPRYDLAGLLPAAGTALDRERAEAAAQLYDPAQASPARLGAARANPVFDGAPALAFAMRAGAALDPRAYTHRRALAVRPSPEGLTRVQLAAADVARARPDLGDVRVVDAGARQWPYLLRADAARAWETLAVGSAERRRGTSQYRLQLPVAPLTLDQLVLESDSAFFDRAYRLTARDPDDTEMMLAAGRLALRAERPRPVTIAFPPTRVTALELAVEDGDEAPLAFRAARARAIAPELFLVAPPGDYTLLVGDPAATAPRYELERVRDVILAVSSGDASAGDLTANPDYSVRARLAGGERFSQIILWTVLVAAVVILALVTLRLAKGERATGP
jgi:hypothetical protein